MASSARLAHVGLAAAALVFVASVGILMSKSVTHTRPPQHLPAFRLEDNAGRRPRPFMAAGFGAEGTASQNNYTLPPPPGHARPHAR